VCVRACVCARACVRACVCIRAYVFPEVDMPREIHLCISV